MATNPHIAALTKEDLRLFLRDFAPNNILLDNVQFTSEELEKAINMAADEYQVMPPLIGGSISSIPRHILMLGASAWLMKSESFLQLRNQATYQDADIAPIGIDDKHQLYLALAARLKEEWNATARAYKQSRNMESSYGTISSGYRNVGRFHNN